MKALYIRFVLFFIGPAIRAEIAAHERKESLLRQELAQQTLKLMDAAYERRVRKPPPAA